jgi:hypothetical protein
MFCDWIRYTLEEELERRWKIEMNGVGVPAAYTSAAGMHFVSTSCLLGVLPIVNVLKRAMTKVCTIVSGEKVSSLNP